MSAGTRGRRSVLGGLLLVASGCAPTAPLPPTTPTAASDVDADGRVDALDACPDGAEDLDGFEDDDGCPDEDDDADGVIDADDECATAQEDRDGLEDDDGCPDEDIDRDRVLDADDACPREAEAYNGHEDDDGCPDAVIMLEDGDRIVIITRIRFVPRTLRIVPDDVSLVDDLILALRSPSAPAEVELRANIVVDETARDGDRRVRALVHELAGAGIESSRLSILPTTAAPREDDAGPTIELRVPSRPLREP